MLFVWLSLQEHPRWTNMCNNGNHSMNYFHKNCKTVKSCSSSEIQIWFHSKLLKIYLSTELGSKFEVVQQQWHCWREAWSIAKWLCSWPSWPLKPLWPGENLSLCLSSILWFCQTVASCLWGNQSSLLKVSLVDFQWKASKCGDRPKKWPLFQICLYYVIN